MHDCTDNRYAALQHVTRRHFLRRCPTGLGSIALASLVQSSVSKTAECATTPSVAAQPHAPTRAKSVIFLHMAGGPSQLETFDFKPQLAKLHGQPCPESFLKGKRFAFIRGVPNMLGPQTRLYQSGESGVWISDQLPWLRQMADELCFIKSMHTDEFNHAPAQFLLYTGFSRQARPSMGSWVTYGLGSENQNLPGFVVLLSGGRGPSAGKSAWGSGFLPSVYQGVQCRSKGEPILFAANPGWMTREVRSETVRAINALNRRRLQRDEDPETETRIAQYELAFQMQMSVPEATDLSREPAHIHRLYGTEPGQESFANNCLLARRLVERGVRFIQLFDWGWDSHGNSPAQALDIGFLDKCRQVDQPIAALLMDLKQRGMLEETLVVWGGEFGRTPMQDNGNNGSNLRNIGRDHHKDAFTVWMAGGGVRGGHTHGATDEFGYYAAEQPVHIHDLQATILHLLGLDHERLTYHFQGRDYRLTDVHGHVVQEVIS